MPFVPDSFPHSGSSIENVVLLRPADAHASRERACSSASATSFERLTRRFLANAVARLSSPFSMVTKMRLCRCPTFGRPPRLIRFQSPRSAAYSGLWLVGTDRLGCSRQPPWSLLSRLWLLASRPLTAMSRRLRTQQRQGNSLASPQCAQWRATASWRLPNVYYRLDLGCSDAFSRHG